MTAARAAETEGEVEVERPNIRRFLDYRAFLLAMIDHLRASDERFSYRIFARRAGFSSPNYLKLVSEGQRNLATSSVDKFGRGLGLNAEETRILRALVELDRARTDDERNAAFAAFRRLTASDEVARVRSDQFAIYEDWYPLVIRELAQLPDFIPDPRWLSRRLQPRITVAQAARALDQLERTGLIARDDSGRLRPTDRTITTGPQVRSLAIRNFHRAHLEIARDNLDRVSPDERDVTAVTVKLSPKAYARAVEEIAAMRKRLLALAEEDDAQEAEVYHCVVACYPTTQPAPDRAASRGKKGHES